MAFFVDVLIACILLLGGNRIHGPFAAFVLYGLTLAILRALDGNAARNGRSLWSRATIKVIVILVVEGLVMLSGMETCDINMANCHRVFF